MLVSETPIKPDYLKEVVGIKIDDGYFRTCARREYSAPIPFIWVRETIQNSVDAGATRINIILDDQTIRLKDNGCGMDANIILDKFFTLGGTFKTGLNPTGGFGEAKKIICFAWSEWFIESCPSRYEKFYVDSSMLQKQPIKYEQGHFQQGTEVGITYQTDLSKLDTNTEVNREGWDREIRNFVLTCTVPCKIFLNGELLPQLDARGVKTEYELATMRVNKSKTEYQVGTCTYGYNLKQGAQIIIRINGITMFRRFMSTQIPALITLDLKGDSISMLNASREGINWRFRDKFDTIIEEILTNPHQIMRREEEAVYIDRYKRTEIEKLKQENSELATIIDMAIHAYKKGQNTSMEDLVYKIESKDSEVAGILKKVLNRYFMSDTGYAFVIHRHRDRKPAIDPYSNKGRRILHCWKLVVDNLMQDRYPDISYCVGFDFDPMVNASCQSGFGKETHILVNPTKVPKYSDPQALGHWLYQKACHEIAHIECENHNESFTIQMGDLLEELSNDLKKWTRLFGRAKLEVSRMSKKQRSRSFSQTTDENLTVKT